MTTSSFPPLLSILIFWPVLGAILVAAVGKSHPERARYWALGVALVELIPAVLLLVLFDWSKDGMQLEELVGWLPAFGLAYHVGVDGISVFLVALTALLAVVALLLSWDDAAGRRPAYAGLVLLLEAGVIGAFAALDLVLFFVFWEAMLVPMYLLTGVLGGPRRVYAALKFFLYTSAGSLIMLAGILVVRFAQPTPTGAGSFDIQALAATPLPPGTQGWLFFAFALAFAIKVPLFPLHNWLVDLYSQSPLGALVLATMLVKVGAYGFLRIAIPLFPDAARGAAPLISILAVVSILYGAMLALAQRDLVRLLAFSSMSHMGFVMLGIFALNMQGIQGASIQLINHGVTVGALFAIAALIRRRTRTLELNRLGGLSARWPILAGFFLLVLFSSVGLPGLNSFVGEFLILLGAFGSNVTLGILAALGIILAAVYLLNAYRRAMWGEPRSEVSGADLRWPEIVALAPLAALVVFIGVFPSTILQPLAGPADAIVRGVTRPSSPEPSDGASAGFPAVVDGSIDLPVVADSSVRQGEPNLGARVTTASCSAYSPEWMAPVAFPQWRTAPVAFP
ncbi:MAG: NADH-quinone oxidoreductase subunit M [Chloroflexota bacterium]|nr:MAG: NADH-quinone oxidoreductase subunit M [Chloroflexota bacterium]